MRRGDVIVIDWPFSDLTGSKKRPAVVMQNDFLNGLIDDTILVQITTTQRRIPGTEVLIDTNVETSSGLRKVCVVNCMNILTQDQTLVLRTIGRLSDPVLRQIEDCLRSVLELP
jgi:mRNA interferase MazF